MINNFSTKKTSETLNRLMEDPEFKNRQLIRKQQMDDIMNKQKTLARKLYREKVDDIAKLLEKENAKHPEILKISQ